MSAITVPVMTRSRAQRALDRAREIQRGLADYTFLQSLEDKPRAIDEAIAELRELKTLVKQQITEEREAARLAARVERLRTFSQTQETFA